MDATKGWAVADKAGRRRARAMAVGSLTVLLLAGCGGHEEREPDAPGTSASPSVSASSTGVRGRPVDVLETRHILKALPDARALPGWEVVGPPTDDGARWCVAVIGAEACARVAAQGSATYVEATTAGLMLAMFSTRTVEEAKTVFDGVRVTGPRSQALGPLGDQRTYARAAKGDEVTAETVVRVGTTVLWTSVTGRSDAVDDTLVREVTQLLVDRTRQVREGLPPTARLDREAAPAPR